MTMFVLKEGRVEKIAREVEAEVLPMIVTVFRQIKKLKFFDMM